MDTNFKVSSMTMLGEGNTKAIANVAINNELIVSGITVHENKDGEMYVQMPQQKNGKDKYEDRVFPITAEAREALNNAVLGTYGELKEQGLDNSRINIETPEKSQSKISVSLYKSDNEKSHTKASGQITVDNCFVIKGITVSENVNSKTGDLFQSVNLPHFKQNGLGQYPPVVKPITADMRTKINTAVLENFNQQTRGAKFSELGGKENTFTYFRQNNDFAEKLMNKLEEKGIPYHAKITETTAVSIKNSDKAAVEDIKKGIANEVRKPSVLGEETKESKQPSPSKQTKTQDKNYQAINEDYYKSLPKDQRSTCVQPTDTAKKLISELEKANVPFSAVVRKNDKMAITVAKENESKVADILSVKEDSKYINPDFYKSLDKSERFTQRMDEKTAKEMVSELEKNGIEHSAVINGNKSAVTIRFSASTHLCH